MNKYVKIIITILLIAFLMACGYQFYKRQTTKELKLISRQFTFDVSQGYSTDISQYLDLNDIDENLKNDILANASVHITDPETTVPLQAGRHSAYILYNDQRYWFDIQIEDKEAPVFEAKDVINVPITYQITDFTPFFTVTDHSEMTLSVDSSQIDFNTPGNYLVTATATDKAGNTSTYQQEFAVNWVYSISEFEQIWYGIEPSAENNDEPIYTE